jgi:hypothetical protein
MPRHYEQPALRAIFSGAYVDAKLEKSRNVPLQLDIAAATPLFRPNHRPKGRLKFSGAM